MVPGETLVTVIMKQINCLAAYLINTLLELNAQLGPIIAIVKISVFHAASVYFFLHKCFDSSGSFTCTLSYPNLCL